MPMKKLAAEYRTAVSISAVFISSRFSAAKVLKVVNPPQNPVIKSSRRGEESELRATSPNRRPMMKAPERLTKSVAQGNDDEGRHLETKNRQAEPSAPPSATRSKERNIIFFI